METGSTAGNAPRSGGLPGQAQLGRVPVLHLHQTPMAPSQSGLRPVLHRHQTPLAPSQSRGAL